MYIFDFPPVGTVGFDEDRSVRELLIGATAFSFVLIFCGRLPAFARGTSVVDARQTIDRFHPSLLAVMKQAYKSGATAHYWVLEPEIVKRFDLRLMIALATGKYWRPAGANSRYQSASA